MSGSLADDQPLLASGKLSEKESRPVLKLGSRISRQSTSFRGLPTSTSRNAAYYTDNSDPSVAFTVLVKREGNDSSDGPEAEENTLDTLVDVTHDAVTGAVQDVCGQAVQEAVQDAFQQALDENVRFDVRANFFTLIAITGVILFWRGIWSLWDKLFGFSIWSELGSIGTGLVIMITFRLIGVPLLDGLPSG